MAFVTQSLVKAAVWAAVILTILAYLQWVERKVIARIQARIGPERVGPLGLLQPLADIVKLLTKEDVMPPSASKFLYAFAPLLSVTLALLPVAVFPFGPEVEIFGRRITLQLTDLDIGVLFLLAVSSLSVYGVVLAGWASNSKYALLGGLRASAQMISYELPMALAVAAPLLVANTLSLRELVDVQQGFYFGLVPRWLLLQAPAPQLISFAIFLMASFAEVNRAPFDLPEAENELVAGFHTEYSSLRFASFFLAEYAHMISSCAFATVLFLGGWRPLWPERLGSGLFPSLLLASGGAIALHQGLQRPRLADRRTLELAGAFLLALAAAFQLAPLKMVLSPLFWFGLKTGALLFVFMWVRGTLPRFRYDQLMAFTWKTLFPVAMLNLLATGALVIVAGG